MVIVLIHWKFIPSKIDDFLIKYVWAVFKRSVTGIWHHVSRKQLQRYVDEDTFRLNPGNCEIDTIDRMEAVIRRIGCKRLTYKELVA